MVLSLKLKNPNFNDRSKGDNRIPDTKLTAVKHALQTAFGVSEFEGIRRLTGLTSALRTRTESRGSIVWLGGMTEIPVKIGRLILS